MPNPFFAGGDLVQDQAASNALRMLQRVRSGQISSDFAQSLLKDSPALETFNAGMRGESGGGRGFFRPRTAEERNEPFPQETLSKGIRIDDIFQPFPGGGPDDPLASVYKPGSSFGGGPNPTGPVSTDPLTTDPTSFDPIPLIPPVGIQPTPQVPVPGPLTPPGPIPPPGQDCRKIIISKFTFVKVIKPWGIL